MKTRIAGQRAQDAQAEFVEQRGDVPELAGDVVFADQIDIVGRQAVRARLKDKRVLLYTGGVKSWSIVSALQDLGMKVVATGTKKSTEEDKARIRELMGEDTKMIDDGSPKALLSTYHEYRADILIAGGRNLYTALKARIPFLDINQEREFGYAGYAGMSELARQLALSMESPVWAAVRKPAPWAGGGSGTVLVA